MHLRGAGILVYGIGSYALGVAALVLLILTSVGVSVPGPVQIDNPAPGGLLDLGLVLAFALQHSVMSRAGFKERWIRVIHPSMERSTYVLATGVFLLLLLVMWQPLPGVVWKVDAPLARGAIYGVAAMGWAYLLLASCAIDHFELFGLQQVWRAFRELPAATLPFRERWMYRFDRHPIMTGFLVGLWATPEMTGGHLLLASAFSLYIIVGVHFEERALRRQWGDAYEAYRRRVSAIVPVLPWR